MQVRISGVFIIVVLAVMLATPGTGAWAGEISSIDHELTIPGWWVVGPFMSGVREAGTSGLAFDRDAVQFKTPLLRSTYPSALVPGGDARWRWYDSDENGTLMVDYPEVTEASMDLVTDEWGFAGGYTSGYAYATLHIEDGPRRALMDLRHAGGLSINGVPWPGDPYGHGMGLTPVLLDDGDNELKISVGSRQRFTLKLLPVEDDLIAFTQSATLPDLVRGETPPRHFGLPLANTTNGWVSLSSASIEIGEWYSAELELDAIIAPLCVYNLPMSYRPDADLVPTGIEEDKFPVTIRVKYAGGETTAELSLDVRNPDQARRVTFISAMDLSVQYYGLLPPNEFDPDREYGLILSLHGAGVEGIGQAKSYQQKKWAYVVAPTNRRRFGFDWQDWGQQDMLEVLGHAKANNRIDENRIHLTGHSMGGHGTWLNALTFPGMWASAAPSAGWTRFDLYAPMFLRKNLLYGEPKANYIWQLAMRQDDTLALAENGLNLPFYALEGGADDNVPPQQPRLMYERLTRLGYDITYEEVPGKGHWWDHPDTPGTDCIDSAALNEFWETHVRDPWPKKVVFKTADWADSRWAYWVYIHTQEEKGLDSVVRAEVPDRNSLTVTTVNVRSLVLELTGELVDQGRIDLMIDDQLLQVETPDPETHTDETMLVKNSGIWEQRRIKPDELTGQRKWWVYGSWKRVMYQPFKLVYGTFGETDEYTVWNLHIARLYSYHWWYRGNGHTEILSDEQFLSHLTTHNAIAIGGFESNALASKAVRHAGDFPGSSNGITYKLVQPLATIVSQQTISQDQDDAWSLVLIEGGTSIEALKRLPSMMGIYSGAGMPDWMIWDDEVQLKGLGGVIAMGFYDLDWEIDEDLSYFNQDLINRLE